MEEGKTERHRSVCATRILKATAMVLFVLLIATSLIYVASELFEAPRVTVSFSPTGYLGSIENVRFWQDDNKFTWDKVRYATYYIVEADGIRFTVSDNEWICPDELSCEDARVKAVDATGRHRDSDWRYLADNI